MSLEDGTWKLWRDAPDFSPLEFAQRSSTFSADGTTIAGRWEIRLRRHDVGHDFDLTSTA